jgi:tartrate dehydratase beta subunit/fumarate hydratase class I family protein
MAHRSAAEEVSSVVASMGFTTSIFMPRFMEQGCARRGALVVVGRGFTSRRFAVTTTVVEAQLESQFVASAAGQGRAFVQGRRLRRREHQALASWGSRARLREEGPNSDA